VVCGPKNVVLSVSRLSFLPRSLKVWVMFVSGSVMVNPAGEILLSPPSIVNERELS